MVKNHQLASHRSAAERNQNIVMDAIYIAEDTDLGCKFTYQMTNKWLFSIPHWHWRSDFTQTTCPRYQMKPKSIIIMLTLSHSKRPGALRIESYQKYNNELLGEKCTPYHVHTRVLVISRGFVFSQNRRINALRTLGFIALSRWFFLKLVNPIPPSSILGNGSE